TSACPMTRSSPNSTIPSTRSLCSIRSRVRSVGTSRTCWWKPVFSRTYSTRFLASSVRLPDCSPVELAQDQTGRRHAGAGRDKHMLDVGHRVHRRTAQLPDALGNPVHPVDVGL